MTATLGRATAPTGTTRSDTEATWWWADQLGDDEAATADEPDGGVRLYADAARMVLAGGAEE